MLLTILIVSIIVERFWEYILTAFGDKDISPKIKIFGAVAFSLFAVIALKLDFLYALEVSNEVSWGGIILSGLVISQGSHVIHDLVGTVKGIREDRRPLSTDAAMGQDQEV